jgi:TPR repeat protein
MTRTRFNELYDIAKKGKDPKAMLDVAIAFFDGDGVDQNNDEFFAWIKKSAHAGEPEAAYELAYAYRDGIGTQPDEGLFNKWLEEAARLEFPKAMYEIAIRYKEGEGVSTSEERFFELMKKAAQNGYEDAMLELAFAYRYSVGTTRRLRSYFHWLVKAAEAKNAEAMFHLAFAYKNREGIPRRNMKEFFRWLYEAAKKEQLDALFHLAIAYRDGEGTKQSHKDYIRWMRKAAYAGIPAGMYQLAMFYLTKSKPDLQKFSEWIKEALKAGYPRAFIASGLDDLQRELKVPHKDIVALNEDLNGLFDRVIDIKRGHRIKKTKARRSVAHFTQFETLVSMLPVGTSAESAANRLRLYNFMRIKSREEQISSEL